MKAKTTGPISGKFPLLTRRPTVLKTVSRETLDIPPPIRARLETLWIAVGLLAVGVALAIIVGVML